MAKTSSRHHYLPVFFLKKFTNDKGFLHVYDKEKDCIKTKPLSPKSIFFDWDRNTTTLGDKEYDWLEETYKSGDSKFALIYREIESISKKIETEEDNISFAFNILLFVNFIRWRVPARDKIIASFLDDNSINDLTMKIVDRKTNEVKNNDFEEWIKSNHVLSDLFNKMISTTLWWEPFYNVNHFKFASERVRLQGGANYQTLICDNPFIERNLSSNFKEISEFFFPISNNKFAFYLKNYNGVAFEGKFSLIFELAKFESAIKYVACADRKLLSTYVSAYRKFRHPDISFKEKLFEYSTDPRIND